MKNKLFLIPLMSMYIFFLQSSESYAIQDPSKLEAFAKGENTELKRYLIWSGLDKNQCEKAAQDVRRVLEEKLNRSVLSFCESFEEDHLMSFAFQAKKEDKDWIFMIETYPAYRFLTEDRIRSRTDYFYEGNKIQKRAVQEVYNVKTPVPLQTIDYEVCLNGVKEPGVVLPSIQNRHEGKVAVELGRNCFKDIETGKYQFIFYIMQEQKKRS